MYRQSDPEIVAMKERLLEAAAEKERRWNAENDQVLDILNARRKLEELDERCKKITVENGPKYRKRKLFELLEKDI